MNNSDNIKSGNKLAALYKNEMKRAFGRPLIWIGLALACVLTLAASFWAKNSVLGGRFPVSDNQYWAECNDARTIALNNIQEYTERLEKSEQELFQLKADYETAVNALEEDNNIETQKEKSRAEKAYVDGLNGVSNLMCHLSLLRVNVKINDLVLEYRIGFQDYRGIILSRTREDFEQQHHTNMVNPKLKNALERYERITAQLPEEENNTLNKLENYRPAIEAADFSFFEKELRSIAEQEEESYGKTATLEAYDFIEKTDLRKVELSAGEGIIRKVNEYVSVRSEQLRQQETFSGISQEKTYELDVKVNLLKTDLSNGISAERAARVGKVARYMDSWFDISDPNRVINQSLSFAGMLVVLLTVIALAANSIAGDIRSGAVKSLIIAPVSRSKIVWSKILMILTVTYLLTVAVTIFALLAGSAATGIWDHGRVLYNVGSAPRILPFWLATLFSSLIDGVAVFFFGMLALMLSALTRNVVISILAPVGYYVVNLFLTPMGGITTNRFVNAVLPMKNFGNLWFSREVSSMMNATAMFESVGNYRVQYILHPFSQLYSVIFIAVLFAAVIWTAIDGFCRRDIT